MPRPPTIPHEQLKLEIIATAGVVDQEGKISGPTNKVWQEISQRFDGKVSSKYIYQYVHENRFNCYNELKIKNNIKSPEKCQNYPEYSSFSSSENEEIKSTCSEIHVYPEKTFHVLIPQETWESIKPVPKKYPRGNRPGCIDREVLPPFKWESALVDLLWDQHKLQCPYSFKKCYVFKNPEDSGEYIKIEAKCNECGSKAYGRVIQKPVDGDVPLIWRATDSRKIKHVKKRPLKGPGREVIAKTLQIKSVSAYRRLQARQSMDLGDVEPPNLYKTDVLRKAKQEQGRKDNATVPYGVDDVTAVVKMKHKEPYAGSIHDIGIDKFFVHYYTPAQMIVTSAHYKKNYSILSIDATGGLVCKIKREDASSGNIFLYEGVSVISDIQIPVMQMLSEKHDANSILYWLNEYIRRGGPAPAEVVIDHSKALISAIVRAFCSCCNEQDYIEKCFGVLTGRSSHLPSSFLRLDIAHFVSSAGKWDIWRESAMKRVRDFYLRCLGILTLADSLQRFEFLFKHILTVCLSPNEGKDEFEDDTAMENSLSILTTHIKDFNLLNLIQEENVNQDADDEYVTEEFFEEGESDKKESSVKKWIKNIEKNVTDEIVEIKDGRLNPYYGPSIAKEFMRISEKFVMWSAVMVPSFNSPHLTASSTSVESDFSDLKTNILKGVRKPMNIPKFLHLHIEAIEGSCRIAAAPRNQERTKVPVGEQRLILKNESKTLPQTPCNDLTEHKNQSEQTSQLTHQRPEITLATKPQTVSESTDLNEIENWRGLAKGKETRKAQYLNPLPELDAAIQSNQITQPKKILLKNGNMCKTVKLDPSHSALLRNTCAFDSLCHVIATGYILYENYRNAIDLSSNLFFKTIKSLATTGASKETYKLRAHALTEILPPKCSLVMPTTKTKKKNRQVNIRDYDCTINVTTLARDLLGDNPSLSLNTLCCSGSSCTRPKTEMIAVLDTNMNIVLDNGLEALPEAIWSCLKIQATEDNRHILTHCQPPCDGKPTVNIETGNHILIDIDYLSDISVSDIQGFERLFNRPHMLNEFPVTMTLSSSRFALIGVVAYIPGHYIGYARNVNGSWKAYNDLSKSVRNVTGNTKVSAHLMCYVKI